MCHFLSKISQITLPYLKQKTGQSIGPFVVRPRYPDASGVRT